MKIFFSFLALLSLLTFQNAEGCSLNGAMRADDVNIVYGGAYDIQGQMHGNNSVSITSMILSGGGYICAPNITIKTAIFSFNGTIHCSGTCRIICSNMYHPDIFKRCGGGTFEIIVDENLVINEILELSEVNEEPDSHDFDL